MTEFTPITLWHPVHTVDNALLVPAGTALSKPLIDSVVRSGEGKTYPRVPLLDHGSVETDIRRFISAPPYDGIFSDPARLERLFEIMQEVRPLLPVLESLDYFETRDAYTYRHVLVVFSLSILLSKMVTSDDHGMKQNFVFGLTHDIGKVCVPFEILKKQDPLTRSELRIMQHHAVAGYVLLSYYLQDRRHPSSTVARDHHERHDGSGYPRGIRLLDALVEIVAVCGIYDALISSRVYRPVAFDNRTALEEITRMAEQEKTGVAGQMTVTDLSRGGLRFQVKGKMYLAPGDTVQMEFHLDDRNRSRIRKRGNVQSATDSSVGAEFTMVDPTDSSDAAIGYYLFAHCKG